ncbi:MAG: response regulator transcription factor, partial [Candidatus Omnitrophica bacterium]|nr:response regulator transcription factor [Candidatus Omnitrophota bacterium]
MNAKIMIIDAHPVYAPKMAGFLESLTLKNIVVVSCGLKAMEAVLEHKPDVIVLSATLPDADSAALAGQIKAASPSTAIIVQTGLLTTAQAMEAFKSAGVDHVLPRREKDWSAFQGA